MLQHCLVRPVILAFAVTVVLLSPVPAFASSVDEVVELISKNVLKYLEDQGKKELFVDQFKGPKTSGGRLLELRIREKLKADGVSILEYDLEASWTLTGRLSTDTSGKNAVVAVQVELLDGGGNSKAEFKKRFREDPEVQQELANSLPSGTNLGDPDAVLDAADDVGKIAATTVDNQSKVEEAIGKTAESTPSAIGGTVASGTSSQPGASGAPGSVRPGGSVPGGSVPGGSVPGGSGSAADQARKILTVRNIPGQLQKDALDNPSFFADGQTRVRASAKSGFGLEIRVSDSEQGPFVPLVVEDKGGRAFVGLQRNQFFQIHVFNSESFDVGLELRMDGINTMHFQEGATPEVQENGKWLIRADTQGAAIKGWFINPTRVDRFVIKDEPEGVAAELGRPHSIGTIQASFFMARTLGQGQSQFASLFDATRDAVGRGAPTEFGGTMESRVFENGQSLASIAILYRNPTPPDLPPADLAP